MLFFFESSDGDLKGKRESSIGNFSLLNALLLFDDEMVTTNKGREICTLIILIKEIELLLNYNMLLFVLSCYATINPKIKKQNCYAILCLKIKFQCNFICHKSICSFGASKKNVVLGLFIYFLV